MLEVAAPASVVDVNAGFGGIFSFWPDLMSLRLRRLFSSTIASIDTPNLRAMMPMVSPGWIS